MTDVTFTRSEYTAAQYRWRLVRDVCKGSETVKVAGDYYLPRPNASDKSQDNKDRYDAYKKRAVFYNATGRTKHSLVGAVFRTWPTLTVPGALDYVATDIDGQGVSVYQQSQSVIGHLLEVGRHGLLVDYAAVEPGTVSRADEHAGRARANVASYPAESIINWKTRQVGGQHLLSLVVLREKVDVDTDDGFGSEQATQYRVLRLDVSGVYTQEVWEEGSSKAEMTVAPFAPLNGSGQPWRIIPFQFLGSENNDTSIDDSPLYDMAEVNIGHYRNSADYEEAAYLVGQPQPWMSGLDEQWRDHLEKAGIFLGSRAPWLLPVNGACGVWQAQPNTVAKEAMDAKKQDMVSLGARLIERGSAVKTATQADNDSAAEHSVLSLVVSNVSEAYSQCLVWMAEFVNATGEVVYKLNQDFSQITLDATILSALFNAVQGGKLPEGDFWQYLRDRGVINPEKTDDEIRDELEAQSTGPALDDTEVIPNGGKPSNP
ncbi:DUF4055 domain-containing protein [Pseudomonas extremaustralis]|uniref:DUF4055 domain-containing protein n=1 Tax=Pseudomonas extremaustralis TaxID=359110 RepID=A0A5C5Q0Z4_9PSED|nr:DUF4055 domain-containing protein [Pseudomonas extremaustralis]EZI23921.1 hypothetical protein PE143B_0129530 [Pseudomonas extremaustralis 14-3 substr. 14-3b]TWR98010.1 DUF4055 domain-containing protein [Pseudomonas extremaustralis]SDE61790.1 protein of unknown function [Pseudomonas extremaustralis]